MGHNHNSAGSREKNSEPRERKGGELRSHEKHRSEESSNNISGQEKLGGTDMKKSEEATQISGRNQIGVNMEGIRRHNNMMKCDGERRITR